jgi:membrane protease YdiL (CAAX protease family)
VYHAFSFSSLKYVIPLFLVAVPFILQRGVKLRFSLRDAATGLLVSMVILLPLWYFMSRAGKGFAMLPAEAVLYQLIGVSFSEEVYFRGLLQERIGNTAKGVLMVSLLFSLMHVPQFIVYKDIYSLLTFFPSLVMGVLYLRTSNLLPPIIFHFLSNIVFLGFCDIL